MRVLNAWTLELDDSTVAVAEILEQLDLQNRLLANSAAFITCSYDYVETGIVEAVCEALPFDVVGCTTLTNATNDRAGGMLLCLTVLTADDCHFSTAITQPLGHGDLHEVEETYNAAVNALGETPKLVLGFFPMLDSIGGEIVLSKLDAVAGGTPVFGTLACDFDTTNYSNSFTIHNGECTRECMSILLISGNVAPRFVVLATSEQNLSKQQAIITASEGSLLQEVNGIPARDYFTSIGLMQGGGIEGVSSVPFMVDYGDGSQPVARAIYSINDDGSAVCGGVMPKGSTLFIGRMDVEDILSTVEQALEKLLVGGSVAGIVMFPCLGRNMVLGGIPLAEAEKVQTMLGSSVPFHLAYSGGEVCPVHSGDSVVNRFHNFTFICCAL